MKSYLSFGAGVNSVALYLLMERLCIEFEAVFVDHGADWPETYEYVNYFVSTGRKITVLIPEYRGHTTLLGYCQEKRMTPNRMRRWCTDCFKVRPFQKYVESPCFVHLGIDAGEIKRAKLSSKGGLENRYLLIEHGINRAGCEKMILDAGLTIPMKSGCWICPFQRRGQWRQLRRMHPELYCAAQNLETNENEKRRERGKKPFYTLGENKPLSKFINDKQAALPGMEEMEYPPCHCGL